MSFKSLLDRWQQQPQRVQAPSRYHVRLDVDDAARLHALDQLFPGMDVETIIADLLHTALDAAEAAMPYQPGDTVIQEDDHGDPVYADTGLTPRYVALLRAAKDQLK
ncbi:MAG: type 1 pili tip component [Pseudomonadota bacterium]